MQVQVSTDSHITGSENLNGLVTEVVEKELNRFSERITRVEVHFSDESSSVRSGQNDKRCLIEVRLAGLQPISASDCSDTVVQALNGAARKIQTALDRTLGKRDRR